MVMTLSFVTKVITQSLADLSDPSALKKVQRHAVELDISGGSEPYAIARDRIDEVTEWLAENDVDHVIDYPARRFVSAKPRTVSISDRPITLIIPQERETEFVLRWSDVLDLGDGE